MTGGSSRVSLLVLGARCYSNVASHELWGGCLRAFNVRPGFVQQLHATGNHATYGAAISIAGSSDVNVTDSYFAGMTAVTGGGISMDDSHSDNVVRVHGTTFEDCHAAGAF